MVEDSTSTVRAIEQVRLGGTGLRVSRLALGMMSYGRDPERSWALGETDAEPIVRRAVEAGFTFFDTADMYSDGESEVVTGNLLRKFLRREEFVVATKVFYPTTSAPNGRGLSRKHIMAAIDASLKRLRMDHVDLYQIHRWDSETPIEETMLALHDLVRVGKVRYLGASTMRAWQFAKAQHVAHVHGWTPFVAMQNRYNLLYREEEREMLPQCVDSGVGVLPYSPLAQGFLTGTRDRGASPSTARAREAADRVNLYGGATDQRIIDAVGAVAGRHRVPPARVALAWLLHQLGVTAPIVGATSVEQIDDAVAATGLTLSAEDIDELERPYRPRNPID